MKKTDDSNISEKRTAVLDQMVPTGDKNSTELSERELDTISGGPTAVEYNSDRQS